MRAVERLHTYARITKAFSPYVEREGHTTRQVELFPWSKLSLKCVVSISITFLFSLIMLHILFNPTENFTILE